MSFMIANSEDNETWALQEMGFVHILNLSRSASILLLTLSLPDCISMSLKRGLAAGGSLQPWNRGGALVLFSKYLKWVAISLAVPLWFETSKFIVLKMISYCRLCEAVTVS